jgi:hypothetical protein
VSSCDSDIEVDRRDPRTMTITLTPPRPTPTTTATKAATPTHLALSTELAGLRRRRAEQLVARVGGDRARLEAIRKQLLDRLHRASDDFAATDELRIVDLALVIAPRPRGLWAWQDRERGRPVR